MTRHSPISVALLGFDGFQTLDLTGPLDAFSGANSLQPGCYTLCVTALDGRAFASSAGLRVLPDIALHDAGAIDTLVLAGGEGLRRAGVADIIAPALRERAPTLRRLVSVCTGLYGLAPSGLADGRRVTTHWHFATDIAALYPRLHLEPDAIFIKDGPIYSSAGVTAGIDLALALIEEDYGPKLAMAVARHLVVYLKRLGGQRQFSEPLQFQTRAGDAFAELAAWIAAHLDGDLSVEALASHVGLSSRQFCRRFKAAFGDAPARQVESLRLDAARERLSASAASIENVAGSVGYRSADAFRRAFEQRFGVPPGDYRARFNGGNHAV